MSGILAKLTVKPLLCACGLQLAAIVALGGVLWAQDTWHEGRLADMRAQRNGAQSSVDAWRTRAQELEAANFAHQSVNDTLRRLLDEAQGEAVRLQEAGRAAIAAAQAREADANRTLDAWMDRYADQVRAGHCAAALNAVQDACPAFQGY